MVPEAPLERTEHGLVPVGDGWFVINVRDARWFDTDGSGSYVSFEGENARVRAARLRPGHPPSRRANALYHAEEAQEDFLVLAGECLLLVEGQERLLGPWDFVHCPSWTEHIFVGAGDGPCLVLAVGARRKGRGLVFPVNEIALKHGAGVKTQTSDPREAYAGLSDAWRVGCPGDFPGH